MYEIPGSPRQADELNEQPQQSAAKKHSVTTYALDMESLPLHLKQFLLAVKQYFNQSTSLESTVAHICHGKRYFSRAKLTFTRQNLLFHGKTYFSTAKHTFSRQNILFHGKTYFSTAKLTFPSLASSLSPILKSLVY